MTHLWVSPKFTKTPCYYRKSISGVAIFSEILKSECQFSETNDDFRRCVSLYQELQNSFHNAMLLLMLGMLALSTRSSLGKQETGASLGDKMPKFVKISLDFSRSRLQSFKPSTAISRCTYSNRQNRCTKNGAI